MVHRCWRINHLLWRLQTSVLSQQHLWFFAFKTAGCITLLVVHSCAGLRSGYKIGQKSVQCVTCKPHAPRKKRAPLKLTTSNRILWPTRVVTSFWLGLGRPRVSFGSANAAEFGKSVVRVQLRNVRSGVNLSHQPFRTTRCLYGNPIAS